jgi:hypothetical protein
MESGGCPGNSILKLKKLTVLCLVFFETTVLLEKELIIVHVLFRCEKEVSYDTISYSKKPRLKPYISTSKIL